jgi:hypothetical protein
MRESQRRMVAGDRRRRGIEERDRHADVGIRSVAKAICPIASVAPPRMRR